MLQKRRKVLFYLNGKAFKSLTHHLLSKVAQPTTELPAHVAHFGLAIISPVLIKWGFLKLPHLAALKQWSLQP